MRKLNVFEQEKILRYFSQMFAEGEDPGQGGGEGGEGGADPGQDGEKKYSDADLDRIISQKFAKWQKQQEKKMSEAEKLANMTAEEKLKALEEENAGLKRDKALAEISKTARGLLKDDGISISDDLLAVLVTDDAEKTSAAVKAFSAAFKAAVQEGVKAALKGHEPKGSSGGADGWTKEKILAEPDMDKRQKLIREHLDLFR